METAILEGTLVSLMIGVGLSAACGFRIFVPFLVMNLASRAGYLTLAEGWDWIGSTPAMIAFLSATLLEPFGSIRTVEVRARTQLAIERIVPGVIRTGN